MFRYGLIVAALLALTWSAQSHDYKRPALDGWYSNLHRKGLKFGCCSKKIAIQPRQNYARGNGGRASVDLSTIPTTDEIGCCKTGCAFRTN